MNGIFQWRANTAVWNPSRALGSQRWTPGSGVSTSELDESVFADLQMFLALRKRQRRALLATCAADPSSSLPHNEQPTAPTANLNLSNPPAAAAVSAHACSLANTVHDLRPEGQTVANRAGASYCAEPAPSSCPPSSWASQPPAAAAAVQQAGGKKLFQCRSCPLLLSSASNRARHERNQHPLAVASSQAKGLQISGRKRSVASAQLLTGEDLTDATAEEASCLEESAVSEPMSDGLHRSASSQIVSTAAAASDWQAQQHDATTEHAFESGPIEASHLCVNALSVTTASDATTSCTTDAAATGATDDLQTPPDTKLSAGAQRVAQQASDEVMQVDLEPKTSVEQQSPKPEAFPLQDLALSPDALSAERDQKLQDVCLPFLHWLCQPPMTEVEALVKARRVKDADQLKPIKLNLRFIFGLLVESRVISMSTLQLNKLSQRHVCEALAHLLDQRNLGSTRIYILFLLVKKVLVYLASQESARRSQFVMPNTYASYMFVDAVCTESTQRRKQEARNRALLGVQSSNSLHKSQQFKAGGVSTVWTMPAEAFRMPSMSGLPERLAPGLRPPPAAAAAAVPEPPVPQSEVFQPQSAGMPQPEMPPLASSPPSPASGKVTAESCGDESANELTTEQLSVIAKGSLAYLQSRETTYFVHHLLTATLCLGLAPRTQVLRELRVGTTLVKQADGRYWVRMLAAQNKNSKPTIFPLAVELTEPFDYYLQTLRPQLLQGQQHDYVFLKRNGSAPRVDFAELTSAATTQTIGQPKNPHAFRSAVITAFYTQTGATQSNMDDLANIVSAATAGEFA